MSTDRQRLSGVLAALAAATTLSLLAPSAATADAMPTGAATYVATASATADPFSLASRPGSVHTIYLDFDGGDLIGTIFSSVDSDPVPAFSLDANTAVFSSEEKTMIRKVWEQVAEDFAPFDVNVTTKLTPEEALDRADIADQQYGSHVYITDMKNRHAATCNCGGLGTMTTTGAVGEKGTALAFLGEGYSPLYTSYLAGVISHEVGHTLGFDHHGGIDGNDNQPSEYFNDLGVFMPIMGSSPIDRALTQWSNGDYPASTNQTDQIARLTELFGTVKDDHSDVKTGATKLALSKTARGLISTRTDIDAFAFTVTTAKKKVGRVYKTVTPKTTITVAPAVKGTNLLSSLTIYNSKGKVVKALTAGANFDTYREDPTNIVKTYTATLPAGTYYAVVDGIGNPAPYATLWEKDGSTTYKRMTTPYSDYGSLGGYTITYTRKI
jgi:hypothetical protein